MSFGKRQIFLYQIYPAGQKYQENIFGQPTQQPTLLSHFLNPLQASNILLGIQGINGEAATDLLSLSTYFRTCRQFKRTDGDWAQITLSEILWESILKRSLSHQNAGPYFRIYRRRVPYSACISCSVQHNLLLFILYFVCLTPPQPPCQGN